MVCGLEDALSMEHAGHPDMQPPTDGDSRRLRYCITSSLKMQGIAEKNRRATRRSR